MNIRLFTLALLTSTLPSLASAASFNKGDFIAAEKLTPHGETVVSLKLSKSGKAKLKKLNAESVGQPVHSEIGGVATDFVLKVPIEGDQLQVGPYSESDADHVVAEINHK